MPVFFFKSLNENWLGVHTEEFLLISEMFVSTYLPFRVLHIYSKQCYTDLTIVLKYLKITYILKYSIFSQYSFLYVKMNIPISLVCKFDFVFNKW